MEQKTILFGATGGVATEIARRLVSDGGAVLLCGRNEGELQELSRELSQPYCVFDALQPESIEHAFQVALSELGEVNGVVNGVGSVLLKPAHLTSIEEFQETLALNLTSSFVMLREGIRSMKQGGGSFLFFSTAAASIGLANHEAIAAAKGGIESMVRSAAATYASKGFRINAIAPGLVETKMTQKITSNETSRAYSQKLHPVGRLGNAADIASGAVWLLSPEQSWVSGHVLHIDGGLSNLKG